MAETPCEKVFWGAWRYFAKHDRPVLAYSGGAESNLLLELLAPVKNVLTVLWANAAALPHMADYVRRRTQGWRFVELAASPWESFKAFGIPSTILPMDAVPVLSGEKQVPPDMPHLSDWKSCCVRVRNLPTWQWASANGNLFVHGQRAGEGTMMSLNGLPRPCATWGLLMDWTRGDVLAELERRGSSFPSNMRRGWTRWSAGCAPRRSRRLG